MERDIAFVEIGYELRSHAAGREPRNEDEADRSRDEGSAQADRLVERGRVDLARPKHEPTFLLLDLACHEQRDGRRHEAQRQD